LTADVVIRSVIWGRFSSRRPRGRLECSVWSRRSKAGCVPRERKIETIRLSGFSFARRSLHQQVRDLHEVIGKHSRAPHSSNRSRPSARQRFMPRPRNNTEMRPRCRSEALAVLELTALLISLALGRFSAAPLWDAHHLDAILFARRHVVLAEEPAIASIQVGSVAEGLLVAFLAKQ